ncbi:hypothetical protein CMO88_02255 [Candidatus Woesearchaeota archaeon]|nr:hypothetical protein [Candidatus Woesearchaeota archaeon]|tara:strand:- start:11833 stop:12249 length:417 start_codon:yes stop_codon:yes gene_type:complete
MRLIVNTNRIIAALVKDSVSREILLSEKFEFLSVRVTESEIEEHRQRLLEVSKLTEEEFDTTLSMLFRKVSVVDDSIIDKKMNEAKKIMDNIDPDDTPFIALALAIDNDGIWSDDKHFERQNNIKTWKTHRLYEQLIQ